MKTLIAVPCMDMVHTKFTESLVNLVRVAPPDTNVCMKPSSLIYDSRNLLSLTAMEQNFDRILWLDSDMTFDPDILDRLSAIMDDGYDMVTGLYVKRKTPVIPVLYKRIDQPEKDATDIKKSIEDYLDYPLNSVFPVAGCGFGCVMTSVDLVRKLWNTFGPPFSPFVWCGEDISFCYRAGQIGAKIVCNSSVKCGHIGFVQFTENAYLQNRGDMNAKE